MTDIKTKVVELPTFEQLTDEEKEKALDNYRAQGHEYAWSGEAVDSFKAFCDNMPLTVQDWSVGGRGEGVFFSMDGDNIEELTGNRLHKYLTNNGYFDLVKECCCFTGYCMDDNIVDPIRQFQSKIDLNLTFKELMGDCFHAWIKAYNDDVEYQDSAECLSELFECNEYTFNRETLRIDS